MKRSNRTITFWMPRALASIVLVFTAPVYSQVGAPIIKTSTSTAADPIFIDAYISTGGSGGVTDICSRINSAWTAAVTSTLPSVVIDARGFTYANEPTAGTPWQCTTSPFPTTSNAAGGVLLLGNVEIQTSVTWQIPSRVHVQGIGVSGLNNATNANTLIQALSSLTSGAVVQLGTGSSSQYDVQLKSLTVDAAGHAPIGVLNDSAEEGSTVEDVDIFNASQCGLLIQQNSTSGTAAVNSGPYRNINIQYNTECGSSCNSSNTVGLAVEAASEQSAAVRGIDNVTVSGAGISGSTQALLQCMYVIGFPVQITNSHVEYCTTGIQIGAPGGGGGIPGTNNVEVQNVSTDPYHGWNIAFGFQTYDILLSGITGWGSDILNDTITGNQIIGTGNAVYYLGYYLLGDTASGSSSPAVISTVASQTGGSNAPELTWVVPGDLNVVGNFSSHNKYFKIDDPLDPAHKFLYHSVVESPDMMNVYNGSVTTDKHGMAVVTLPVYFDALNRDFRYQLTAIGSFAQATVAKEVENNRFAIRTSKPGVKVSWQVTGIRQDAYANAHPIQVEAEKPAREQGHYLHPELFESRGKQVAAEQAVGK
jgi:hypothetical protein